MFFRLSPAFVMGVVLGTLTLWSRSIVPAMVFHLLYNTLLISPALMPTPGNEDAAIPIPSVLHPVVIGLFSVAACLLLAYMGWRIGSRERNQGSTQPVMEGMP